MYGVEACSNNNDTVNRRGKIAQGTVSQRGSPKRPTQSQTWIGAMQCRDAVRINSDPQEPLLCRVPELLCVRGKHRPGGQEAPRSLSLALPLCSLSGT